MTSGGSPATPGPTGVRGDSLPTSHRIASLQELEEACQHGPLSGWDALMAADSTATFFQGPEWCMEWYRAYHDLFQPLLMVRTRGASLAGLIPLAVERASGRLTFAGDGMCDYRDVVALPDSRRQLVGDLLGFLREADFGDPFQLGPMAPESETPAIVRGRAGGSVGVWPLSRAHSSWRWSFGDREAVRKLTSKESVRRHVSHYKRQGVVELERLETSESWDRLKQTFFDQHSLRQLYTGRPVTFHDERRRGFYDGLFRRHCSTVHLTALRVGDRVVAMHYGYVWRNVLHWGAPAFDIAEARHSPGQILLALLIQAAEAGGLAEVDLTVGVEEFKKRFSNAQVARPGLDLYRSAPRYYARRFRAAAARIARRALDGSGRPRGWHRVAQAWRKEGPRPVARLLFVAPPGDLRSSLSRPIGKHSLHRNRPSDLLRSNLQEPTTASPIEATVQMLPDLWRDGHTLHTMLVDDRLAAWGMSHAPTAGRKDPATGLELEPASVVLHSLHVVAAGRTDHYRALLAAILGERLAEGAVRAYLVCSPEDRLARSVAEELGWRLTSTA